MRSPRWIPASSVIFVINHRSNMDYVLVTYVAATSSALSYAVGEWAQVWGLRGLIRSMGAYFISRDSREALYRKVLARYVHMATAAGVTQAIFPEGGLSRDGRLRPPKFGLLSYMVSGFDPLGPRDVVFIPVAVNYDRVLEDRMLTSAANTEPGKKPVFGFNAAVFARHFFRHIWMAMRGEWHRFGYTCVSFGEPVSLRKHVADANIDFRLLAPEPRHAEIEKLGNRLMQAVGRVVPALPVSLVSTAMLEAGENPLSLLDIKQRVSGLIGELEGRGAYVHIPRADRDYAIAVGLRMLTLRHLVLEEDGNYRANPQELILLKYYANAIVHLFENAARAGEVTAVGLFHGKADKLGREVLASMSAIPCRGCDQFIASPLAQDEALHLSARRLGERVNEMHLARKGVRRIACLDQVLDAFDDLWGLLFAGS